MEQAELWQLYGYNFDIALQYTTVYHEYTLLFLTIPLFYPSSENKGWKLCDSGPTEAGRVMVAAE